MGVNDGVGVAHDDVLTYTYTYTYGKFQMEPELHITRYFQNFEICISMFLKIRKKILGVDYVKNGAKF